MKIPIAADVKRRAVETLNGATIPYSNSDCQDAVEQLVQDCGGEMEFAGSNDMWRHACIAIIPKAQALKTGGLLSEGELTFRHSEGHNSKYNDNEGDASHVGMYIGSKAYYDDGWNNTGGWCDVFHSSSSRGKVCGSNLTKNDWSDIGIPACIEFPESVYAAAGIERLTVNNANGKPVNMRKEKSTSSVRLASVPNGATVLAAAGDGEWRRIAYDGKAGYMMAEYLSDYIGGSAADTTEEETSMALSGKTCTVIGGGLNLRKSKSTSATRITQIPEGAAVYVYEDDGTWAKVKYDDTVTSHVGYCKSEFLVERGEDSADDFDGEEESGSSDSGSAKQYGIYIPCNSLEAAKALKSILSTGVIKAGE
jgi:uncharacterized protein YgiM (DUF1202 family)